MSNLAAPLKRVFLILALLAGFLLQITSPASGEHYECGDHTSMVARLLTVFGEQNIWRGITNEGKVVEVYVSADGGSWSVLVVQPTGVACIVASGSDWQEFPLKVPDRDA